ncbi:MAG: IS4 family transposase [Limisphaerales bacterium]
MIVCGRELTPAVIERLKRCGSDWSRRALSRQLCEWLDWKGPSGRLQTTAARVAMKRLERRGLLELPPARPFPAKPRRRAAASRSKALPPVRGNLAQIGPVELLLVGSRHSETSRQCGELLERFHPLGAHLCGSQLRYLIRCRQGVLGVITFSAAARRLRARDEYIGWSDQARAENLHRVVNNSRFLIRPGVQVQYLASHVLGLALKRLPGDWEQRYGYRPWLVETFVEPTRYRGSCYRASNWRELPTTTSGRGRNDRQHRVRQKPKRIFLYRLNPQAPERLRQLPPQPRLARAQRAVRPPSEPADWAEAELGQAQLGDQRLRQRLLVIARDFYARPQSNLPQSCNGDRAKTKAAYRFFDHEQVSMEAVLRSHYAATAARVAKEPVVLAVQDTTSLNYSTHPAAQRLGPIGSEPEGAVGLLVHDTMAFNREGTPLGLLDVQCWARDPEQFGKKHRRRQLPFEEKESVKWLRSLQALERVQSRCAHTQLVSVGDREADIYELFLWATQKPGRPQLLIRAEQNRRVEEEHRYLWEQMAAQPLRGLQEVRLPRRGNRAGRVAQLEVRFGAMKLRCPQHGPRLPKVRLWAVWARELRPPSGQPPVEWMLLSTLPVESFPSASEKLDWYAKRWGIEVFHRTLKSGCQIENRQLGHADRIEGCLAIDLVVAWRIFHLCKLGRQTPAVPCTVYFEQIEWQALVGFIHKDPIPPPQPPSLRAALRMTASLGGFLGRKIDGEPGTQTLWLGLQRLDDITEAWKVFSQLVNQTVSSNRTYG